MFSESSDHPGSYKHAGFHGNVEHDLQCKHPSSQEKSAKQRRGKRRGGDWGAEQVNSWRVPVSHWQERRMKIKCLEQTCTKSKKRLSAVWIRFTVKWILCVGFFSISELHSEDVNCLLGGKTMTSCQDIKNWTVEGNKQHSDSSHYYFKPQTRVVYLL